MAEARRKVLLADDNQDGVDTLAAFLEMLGFKVRVARDGGAAIDLAAREMPDLAILDLGMPVVTGWEVCRAIRAMPGGERVRMVALSGWGSEEARRKSDEAGFDAHWTKPADASALLAALGSKQLR